MRDWEAFYVKPLRRIDQNPVLGITLRKEWVVESLLRTFPDTHEGLLRLHSSSVALLSDWLNVRTRDLIVDAHETHLLFVPSRIRDIFWST